MRRPSGRILEMSIHPLTHPLYGNFTRLQTYCRYLRCTSCGQPIHFMEIVLYDQISGLYEHEQCPPYHPKGSRSQP